jgi:protein-L-isoaspartate(D-aspartate) O-methyltransferase
MFFRRRGEPSPLEAMIRDQLEARGISDPRVLDAVRRTPRERFIPEIMQPCAYEDRPLPIGEEQTISQPYMTALMTQVLEIKPSHKVLEIGTGSGYQTALLACLAREVYTVERFPSLSENAQRVLEGLGVRNVHFRVADGSLGLDAEAPFDRIVITAAAPVIPTPFLEQLAPFGILVLPVGKRDHQMLMKVWRTASGISMEECCGCLFVPLVGQGGYEVE